MTHRTLQLTFAIVLFGSAAGFTQDAELGKRLTERWCADCHAGSGHSAKARQVIPFEAIAAKPGVNAELIANFLMLPHSAMPNLPIRRSEAEDIAAFIMQMKK
ncbi:MAG TPA: cytochrome c [Bradyrhizobium sp.]|uniref:cytochrome c n=1 Tax=Bradyrhizobium sp. TaxID=376 RepID=UPI002D7FD9BD|nr:cytochrome c [Bradyrhizobium sp.]HET7889810.1 cytochrome c [Bradyrhizobium sp.]